MTIESCNRETGGRSHDINVDPDGRYSWRSTDSTQAMLKCMRRRGYSPER